MKSETLIKGYLLKLAGSIYYQIADSDELLKGEFLPQETYARIDAKIGQEWSKDFMESKRPVVIPKMGRPLNVSRSREDWEKIWRNTGLDEEHGPIKFQGDQKLPKFYTKVPKFQGSKESRKEQKERWERSLQRTKEVDYDLPVMWQLNLIPESALMGRTQVLTDSNLYETGAKLMGAKYGRMYEEKMKEVMEKYKTEEGKWDTSEHLDEIREARSKIIDEVTDEYYKEFPKADLSGDSFQKRIYEAIRERLPELPVWGKNQELIRDVLRDYRNDMQEEYGYGQEKRIKEKLKEESEAALEARRQAAEKLKPVGPTSPMTGAGSKAGLRGWQSQLASREEVVSQGKKLKIPREEIQEQIKQIEEFKLHGLLQEALLEEDKNERLKLLQEARTKDFKQEHLDTLDYFIEIIREETEAEAEVIKPLSAGKAGQIEMSSEGKRLAEQSEARTQRRNPVIRIGRKGGDKNNIPLDSIGEDLTVVVPLITATKSTIPYTLNNEDGWYTYGSGILEYWLNKVGFKKEASDFEALSDKRKSMVLARIYALKPPNYPIPTRNLMRMWNAFNTQVKNANAEGFPSFLESFVETMNRKLSGEDVGRDDLNTVQELLEFIQDTLPELVTMVKSGLTVDRKRGRVTSNFVREYKNLIRPYDDKNYIIRLMIALAIDGKSIADKFVGIKGVKELRAIENKAADLLQQKIATGVPGKDFSLYHYILSTHIEVFEADQKKPKGKREFSGMLHPLTMSLEEVEEKEGEIEVEWPPKSGQFVKPSKKPKPDIPSWKKEIDSKRFKTEAEFKREAEERAKTHDPETGLPLAQLEEMRGKRGEKPKVKLESEEVRNPFKLPPEEEDAEAEEAWARRKDMTNEEYAEAAKKYNWRRGKKDLEDIKRRRPKRGSAEEFMRQDLFNRYKEAQKKIKEHKDGTAKLSDEPRRNSKGEEIESELQMWTKRKKKLGDQLYKSDITKADDGKVLESVDKKKKKQIKMLLSQADPTEYFGQDFLKLGELIDTLKKLGLMKGDAKLKKKIIRYEDENIKVVKLASRLRKEYEQLYRDLREMVYPKSGGGTR